MASEKPNKQTHNDGQEYIKNRNRGVLVLIHLKKKKEKKGKFSTDLRLNPEVQNEKQLVIFCLFLKSNMAPSSHFK